MLIKNAFAVLAAVSSGCIIHAVDTTTSVSMGFVEAEPTMGPAGPVAVEAQAVASTILVRAEQPRTCKRETYEIIETTTSKEAEVDAPSVSGPNVSGGQDPVSAVIGLVYLAGFGVMAVTGAISGVATAIEMGISDDKVVRTRRLSKTVRTECPISVPGLTIEVALSSGTRLTGSTNEHGLMLLQIPSSEPPKGTATVIAGASSWRLDYERPTQTPLDERSCVAMRNALVARIQHEPDHAARARLALEIPACTTQDSDRERTWSLTKGAAIAALADHCASIEVIGAHVQAVDRAFYDTVFTQQIDIAGCSPTHTESSGPPVRSSTTPTSTPTDAPASVPLTTERAACIQARQKLAREALGIADLKSRQIALGSLPRC